MVENLRQIIKDLPKLQGIFEVHKYFEDNNLPKMLRIWVNIDTWELERTYDPPPGNWELMIDINLSPPEPNLKPGPNIDDLF